METDLSVELSRWIWLLNRFSKKTAYCITRPFFYFAGLMLYVLFPLIQPVSGADYLDNWNWRNPLPQGSTIKDVTYGNNKFVAVGRSGTIMTSADGASWTVRPSGSSNELHKVAYGNGIFVAVGMSGAILTSTDGEFWTLRTVEDNSSSSYYGITYGDGIFVAVGETSSRDYIIITSSDGVTWTPRTFPKYSLKSAKLPRFLGYDGYDWYYGLSSAAYGNGIFVAVNRSYSSFTSTDGVNWNRNDYTSQYPVFRTITYGNGLFIAIGSNDDPAGIVPVSTSTDGVNWTTGGLGNRNVINGLTYGNGVYIAVGDNGTILTSPDGVNWTQRSSGVLFALSGIAYENGTFIATGESGVIITSPDGVNWTNITARNPDGQLTSISYGNGIFVALEDGNNILTSPDGVAWTVRASGANYYKVAYLNGLFVAVGSTIQTSPDGVNWATRVDAVSYSLYGITYGNGIFVAVGNNVDGGAIVLISYDGVTWNPGTISGINSSGYILDITYGNGTFVAIVEGKQIAISTDGLHWTTSTHNFYNIGLYNITYGNGIFVVSGSELNFIGIYGHVFTSTDGLTWDTNYSFPSQSIPIDIIYSNGSFVSVGAGILTSTDGITWAQRKSYAGYELYSVAYGNGTFVAVGSNGTILQSDTICTAILSNDLKLHVPALTYNGQYYWADFMYDPGPMTFSRTDYDLINDTSPYNICNPSVLFSPFLFLSDYKLHLPVLAFKGAYYWADFKSDKYLVNFSLTGYGLTSL